MTKNLEVRDSKFYTLDEVSRPFFEYKVDFEVNPRKFKQKFIVQCELSIFVENIENDEIARNFVLGL